MLNTITELKIGTRSSKLALKQAKLVLKSLENLPEIKKKFSFKIIKVKTKGDIDKSKILDSGYKGFFTKKIDDLLLKKKIDLAVHSAKDIPSKIDNKISITAFLKREDPRDILLSKKNYTFNTLPQNLNIGTSSIRRQNQINNIRHDLKIKHMRGNIEKRIKKLPACFSCSNQNIKNIDININTFLFPFVYKLKVSVKKFFKFTVIGI